MKISGLLFVGFIIGVLCMGGIVSSYWKEVVAERDVEIKELQKEVLKYSKHARVNYNLFESLGCYINGVDPGSYWEYPSEACDWWWTGKNWDRSRVQLSCEARGWYGCEVIDNLK